MQATHGGDEGDVRVGMSSRAPSPRLFAGHAGRRSFLRSQPLVQTDREVGRDRERERGEREKEGGGGGVRNEEHFVYHVSRKACNVHNFTFG